MNREKSTNKIEPLVRRNSLLAALMITYNILCVVLQQSMKLDISYGNMLAVVIIMLIFVFNMINNKIILSPKISFLCLYIVFFMLFSWVFVIKTNEYIISFIFFGLIGCYVGLQKINTELVLRYLIYISFLPLFFFNSLMEIHYIEGLTSGRMDMGISYALLPMILAALLHFLYYRETSNIIIKIGYLVNVILMIVLLMTGTRGGLLSLLIFFILVFANQYGKKQKNSKQIHHKRRPWIIWLSVCLGVITIIFYDQIMLAASHYFSGLGLHFNIFNKTESLINNTGDGTNGRIILWKATAEGIFKSPIWGHGWGSFVVLTGLSYPHNIILELMYQGGLLLAIPILLPVFRGLYKCASGQIKNIDDHAYMILLISSCLPRLLVSASLWNNQIFWMMLAFMMARISAKERPRMPIFPKGDLKV